ncbi:hypothetical protein D3C74_399600 [compost metagenome]
MNFIGQCAAVRIAHYEPVCSGFPGLGKHSGGILRIVLVAVEEMLGIEDDLETFMFEISNRITDHRKILF